eukprot:CAMPEP_0170566138 /NCGR_PEP_ID=MMETSP0211-20121228/79645_1 /TAXON_ID=311385 /ORGANISM="Pseudokeronopsis sp., Strain OXSARD2" /LENGTH=46 /DNA_ID= /DNA_START= /DNA_END= /DNA_ORIENTATION=
MNLEEFIRIMNLAKITFPVIKDSLKVQPFIDQDEEQKEEDLAKEEE